MPQTSDDFIWWAFNLAFLAVVWFMKRDLGEIKADGKANRLMNEENARNVQEHKGVCTERHRRLDYEIAEMKERRKND